MHSSFVSGISRADAYRLIRALGGDLIALLRDASRVRDARMGRVITYSRKVFILLTNLCRDVCGYCTFAREPGDPLAHTMGPEEVLASARSARKAGRKEALFSLGDKPELHYPAHRDWLERRGLRPTVEYLQMAPGFRGDGLAATRESRPLSREEMFELQPVNISMGMMLESTSSRLLRPGEAHRCPDKVPEVGLAALETAGQLRIPFTGSGVNLQIPLNLAGDAYRSYLRAAIDDWGGISPGTRDINSEMAWPQIEALRSVTNAEGFELRERLAAYPGYVRDSA